MKYLKHVAFFAGLGMLLMAMTSNNTISNASSLGNGSGSGIEFYHGSFSSALDRAGETKKLVFVDVYADWCKPCKLLSQRTFTKDEVGDFFNENFVNIKLNSDAAEHRPLMEKYDVRALPTLLFLDGEGNVVHTAMGYLDADELIKEAEVAMSK